MCIRDSYNRESKHIQQIQTISEDKYIHFEHNLNDIYGQHALKVRISDISMKITSDSVSVSFYEGQKSSFQSKIHITHETKSQLLELLMETSQIA